MPVTRKSFLKNHSLKKRRIESMSLKTEAWECVAYYPVPQTFLITFGLHFGTTKKEKKKKADKCNTYVGKFVTGIKS